MISDLLKQAALQWPSREFIVERSGERLSATSFSELRSLVARWGAELQNRDITPGDRVALWSENSLDWICGYFAILHCGAVVVPFDPQLSADHVESCCKFCGAKLILLSAALESRWTAISFKRNIAQLETIRVDSVEALIHEATSRKPHDTAMIIFTSGTTGDPKAVELTHDNLVSDARGVVETINVNAQDNFLLLLPLFHMYSLTVNVLCALVGGARATLATSYKSRDIVDDIRIAKVTMLIGVPQIYENMMQSMARKLAALPTAKRFVLNVMRAVATMTGTVGLHLEKQLFKSLRQQAGLNTVRIMVSGGAALRPEVNRYFSQFGFDLVQGYGLTETSPVLSCNPPEHNRIGSVGPAVSGAKFRINEPDSKGVGEICVRGPMVMPCYYQNEKATAQVLRDGWFYTGDAGWIDDRGYLFISGRIKNVIVTSAGKNVYPEEIEAELNVSEFILESLVLSVANPKSGGEEIVAWVVPDPTTAARMSEQNITLDFTVEIRKVIDEYNSKVPLYRQIRRWKIREQEFEKTSTRKIRRFMYKDFDHA